MASLLSPNPGSSSGRLLELITEDVKEQMLQAPFNKSLKIEVYHEFLAYAENAALECLHIDSLSSFFHHLHWEKSPYAKDLNGFKDVFAGRIATVYLFKIRFLVKLGQALKQNIHETYLLNPQFIFHKIVPQGEFFPAGIPRYHIQPL